LEEEKKRRKPRYSNFSSPSVLRKGGRKERRELNRVLTPKGGGGRELPSAGHPSPPEDNIANRKKFPSLSIKSAHRYSIIKGGGGLEPLLQNSSKWGAG